MARRSTGGRAGLAALAAVMIAVSCSGDGGDDPGARSDAARASWRVDALAPIAEGREATSVIIDDTIVVLTVTDSGALQSWTGAAGGTFEPASPGSRPSDGLSLTAGAAGSDGTGEAIAVGIDLRVFAPVVFTSTDAGEWAEVDTTGFDGPGDPLAVTATDNGYVVVGWRRSDVDPTAASLSAVAWWSLDGTSWTESELPGAQDGPPSGVVGVDGEVLAVGRAAGAGTLWRSNDGGNTWNRDGFEVDGVDSPVALVDIAADRDVVVAVAQPVDESLAAEPRILRSTDGGRRWTPVVLGGASLGGQAALALAAGPGGFSIATDRFVETSDAADRCYTDVDACRGPRPLVLLSATGETWEEVDLGAARRLSRVERVHQPGSGGLVLVGVDEAGSRAVWTWPAEAGPVPTIEPSSSLGPSEPLASHGDDLDAEVTYRFPLSGHCGFDYLGELDGSHWYVDEPRSPTLSAAPGEEVPESWPVADGTIYGYLTLTADDTVEYSIPGNEVIGVYLRSDREPPDCR